MQLEFFFEEESILYLGVFLFDSNQMLSVLVFVGWCYNDIVNMGPNFLMVILKLELFNR